MHISKKVKFFLSIVLMGLFLPTVSYGASYTVAKGDSLYTIGELFNTTSTAIMEENHLTGTMIFPGQQLNVPSDTYTVQSGDTLYLIAKGAGITLDVLRKVNNKWDNDIYPGQILLLPMETSENDIVKSSVIPYTTTDAEVDLLARLITAEADGEPYQAKVGVGSVVLNRIIDSCFPDTIEDVIYEKSYGYYQFTPVENGFIYKPASEDAIKAAYDALNGADPSNGAIFYFDDSATNKWLWSRPLAARIGKMVFVY